MKIYCTLPTARTKKIRESLGISSVHANNLYSLWMTKHPDQAIKNMEPTMTELQELLDESHKEKEDLRFGIYDYTAIYTPWNTGSSVVYRDSEGKVILNTIKDDQIQIYRSDRARVEGISEVKTALDVYYTELWRLQYQEMGIPNALEGALRTLKAFHESKGIENKQQSNNNTAKKSTQPATSTNIVEQLQDTTETALPIQNDTSALSIDTETSRARLAREMRPKEIADRANLIATRFSEMIDDMLESEISRLEAELDATENPIEKLSLAAHLHKLQDPDKGRKEFLSTINIDTIVSAIRDEFAEWLESTPEELDSYYGEGTGSHYLQEYTKIVNNFDTLFEEAIPTIEANESIRLKVSKNQVNDGIETNTKNTYQAEDEQSEEDADDVNTEFGDKEGENLVTGNDGYIFKARMLDPSTSIRNVTRRALSNIKRVTNDGEAELDDLGNIRTYPEHYIHTTMLNYLSKKILEPSDFSIRNEDGSYSFPALEEMQASFPWVSQVIERLQANPILVSTFYNDFRKEFIHNCIHREDKTVDVNMPVAIESTSSNLKTNYEEGNQTGTSTIYDSSLNIVEGNRQYNLDEVNNVLSELQEVDEGDEEEITNLANRVVEVLKNVGYTASNIDVNTLKDTNNLQEVLTNLQRLLNDSKNLSVDLHLVDYFSNYYNKITAIVAKVTELDHSSTFRQGGNSYPSYAAPNYIETTFRKLIHPTKRVAYILENFGKYQWFRDQNSGVWRNQWLDWLDNDQDVRNHVEIKTLLQLDATSYEDWSEAQIARAFLTEYFQPENKNSKIQYAYYNFPIFADTTTCMLIRMPKFTGRDYKEKLRPLYRTLIQQELDRMKLVEERKAAGVSPIKNFDKRGSQFCFLPALNSITVGDKTFIEVLREARDAQQVENLMNAAIDTILKAEYDEFLSKVKLYGEEDAKNFMESAGVKSTAALNQKIEEYVWNQIYASSQMVQILTTDLAFYKDSTDFQKRFKEVSAAGTKLNTNSKYGRQVENTVYLADDVITSPTFVPLKTLLDKAVTDGNISAMDRDALLNKFKHINAVDAQAIRSLSSYRSVLDMLGMWTDEMDKTFERLQNGEFDASDFNIVWQTIKPFVFTQIEKPDGLGNTIKVPHQNKNSEFLLLATYQTLQTVLNRSAPLKALQEFMEHEGIDVVQYESAVKAGGQGIVNINTSPRKIAEILSTGVLEVNGKKYSLSTVKLDPNSVSKTAEAIKNHFDELLSNEAISQDDYNEAMKSLRPTEAELYNFNEDTSQGSGILYEAIRNKNVDTDVIDNDGYNMSTVHRLPYEDYMIAQPTPEHLFDALSTFGSQFRNLVTSDMPENMTITIDGHKIEGREAILREYQSLIVENLLEDYQELIGTFSSIEALQKRLFSIIDGNPKYNRDIKNALQIVDYNGRKVFNIPLHNPTTTTKVQELINSLFKNSITKQKTPGGACILASNIGFTDELKVVRNNDGSIKSIQVFMPAYSKQFFEEHLKEIKGKNGTILGYKLDPKFIKDNPDIMQGIGYRIPTEAKYSMVPLEIVGFLPQQNGSAMMMPAELTTMAGLDFDKHQC